MEPGKETLFRFENDRGQHDPDTRDVQEVHLTSSRIKCRISSTHQAWFSTVTDDNPSCRDILAKVPRSQRTSRL